MTSHPLSDPSLERQARKRAGAKLGWYIHAAVYIAVNLVLAVAAASFGKHWAVFPALGWGLGLVIHGTVVYLVVAGLYEHLLEVERTREGSQRDAW
jgi:hypothetical protein